MLNEIQAESVNTISRRAAELGASFDEGGPKFRASYMAHHLRAFLADQIRALRGDQPQREFGVLIDKPQSVVSRLEDEEYGKVSLQTLIDVATKLDIAIVVRFVDFATFLRITSDLSDHAVAPRPYDSTVRKEIERLTTAKSENGGEPSSAQVYNFTKNAGRARISPAPNDNIIRINVSTPAGS
jgi:hypothetical protein